MRYRKVCRFESDRGHHNFFADVMEKLAEYFQTPRHLAVAVVIVSAAALLAAYTAQYGFGLKPCQLCLYQRVPYFLNIVLGGAAFFSTFRYPRLVTLFLYLAAAAFLAGAVVAFFHAGVEYKWWPGLPSCSGQILPENASLEDLRNILTQQPIVRCDEAAWTLFGVSMAGYNYLLSFALGVALLHFMRKEPA